MKDVHTEVRPSDVFCPHTATLLEADLEEHISTISKRLPSEMRRFSQKWFQKQNFTALPKSFGVVLFSKDSEYRNANRCGQTTLKWRQKIKRGKTDINAAKQVVALDYKGGKCNVHSNYPQRGGKLYNLTKKNTLTPYLAIISL